MFPCTTSFSYPFAPHTCNKKRKFLFFVPLFFPRKKKRRHGRKGWPGVTDRSRGIKSRSGPTDITRRVMIVFLFPYFLWLVLLEAFLSFDWPSAVGRYIIIWRAGERKGHEPLTTSAEPGWAPPVDNTRPCWIIPSWRSEGLTSISCVYFYIVLNYSQMGWRWGQHKKKYTRPHHLTEIWIKRKSIERNYFRPCWECPELLTPWNILRGQ